MNALSALFQKRIDGDDALLRLAARRFAQAGLAAEIYAGSAEELEHGLTLAPAEPCLPMVHLDRRMDVLNPAHRRMIRNLAARFRGRVRGFVVHDNARMSDHTADLVSVLRTFDHDDLGFLPPDQPCLFLEYAAGLAVDWFADVAHRLRHAQHVNVCIDVGHVGIRQARNAFRHDHPGLDLSSLSAHDPRLPDLVADVQTAVDTALPTTVALIRAVCGLGRAVHFHLHDGHPLIEGLSDHKSFLTSLPLPFAVSGRCSLRSMYGPSGLARIIEAATEAANRDAISFNLEIHEERGRLPLADGAELFHRWKDLAHAERMNHWLAVLTQNNLLATAALEQRRDAGQGAG